MNCKTSAYNVVYSSPSVSDRGLMPLGNGEMGVSLWATKDKISCYISRTDALSECDRNIKLGMLNITFTPNILKFKSFKQELIIENGKIEIKTEDGDKSAIISAFVEKSENSLRIKTDCNFDLEVRTTYITWRNKNNDFVKENGNISKRSKVKESGDICYYVDNKILIYHKNKDSIVNYLMKLEGVFDEIDSIDDNLKNRIFGGICSAYNGKIDDTGAILTFGKQSEIKLSTFSQIVDNEKNFIEKQLYLHDRLSTYKQAESKTKKFWKNYFDTSYVFVEGDNYVEPYICDVYKNINYENTEVNDTTSNVTRAYILSKYMHKCCLGGTYPMRFNGGHFNTGIGISFEDTDQPNAIASRTPDPPVMGKSPDERSWGNMLLWQNERLLYHPLFYQNDLDSIKKFLKYYCSFGKINNIKAKKYYNAEGEYNTEIMTSFGLMPDYVYGVERSLLKDGYCENRYGGAVDISPGLEQSMMLISYCEFAKDKKFFSDTALPYIISLLRYIETRFKKRENGKIVLEPLNSVETYWDTKNPVTVVAGIKAVLKEMEKSELSLSDREYIEKFKTMVPDYTFRIEDGKKILEPAEKYYKERHNVEIPQIYTVFPFTNQMKDISERVIMDTYDVEMKQSGNDKGMEQGMCSSAKSFSGWHYEGIVASILGKTSDAVKILEYNSCYKHINARFPAMWGPAYDSLPDSDHGANIQTQLQLMLMRKDKNKIYICPAFPDKWSCKFKLWVDKDTYVKVETVKGRLKHIFCSNTAYELVLTNNIKV